MIAARRGPVVVLAGPGNNGGDAYVCARLLHEQRIGVVVVSHGDPRRLPAEASAALGTLRAAGIGCVDGPPSEAPALVVDGLFGVGLSRPPVAPYADWIAWANASGAPVLALD